MKKNIGPTDKIIRFLLATILLILFAANLITGIGGWIAIAFAGILILTGFTGSCPLYTLLGISTCKKTTV